MADFGTAGLHWFGDLCQAGFSFRLHRNVVPTLRLNGAFLRSSVPVEGERLLQTKRIIRLGNLGQDERDSGIIPNGIQG
jgi:hypothetical protein